MHNFRFLSLHNQNPLFKCNVNSGDISPDSAVLKHSIQKYRCPFGNGFLLQIVQNPSCFSRSTSICSLCFFISIPPYQPFLNEEPLKRCSFLHLLFESNIILFFHAKTVQQQGVETSYDLNLYKYRQLHHLKDLNGDAVSYQSVLYYEVNCSIL